MTVLTAVPSWSLSRPRLTGALMPANPLITAKALAGELDAPPRPVLLDVRWQLSTGADRAAYEAGHLPAAAFVDLDGDLAGPPGDGGRHPLPHPARFEAAMRRSGVRHDRPVVVYDEGDLLGAARAWWVLGWFGHQDVRVLDGGVRAWVEAGLPLATKEPARAASEFTARPGGRPALDADGAARVA